MRFLTIIVLLVLSLMAAFQSSVSAAGEAPLPPDIAARNAIVIDADTGQILYEKAATTRVAPASLTKLFTAFLAIEISPLDRLLPVADSDLVGESSAGLQAGEVLTLEELLYALILPSGNDAAMTIARNLGATIPGESPDGTARFLDVANARLSELGLGNTRLANPHGLDEPNHYSSARDIAALTMYAFQQQPVFKAVLGTSEFQAAGHNFNHTNQLPQWYPGVIGGKTGSTDAAGQCLVEVAVRDGRTMIVVLLGSDLDAWYADAAALLDHGFAVVASGATVPFGQAVVADQLPLPNTPEDATSQPEVSIVSNGGSTLVSLQLNQSSTPWPLVKWPLIALCIAAVLLVCCGQFSMARRLGMIRLSDRKRRAILHPAPDAPRLSPRRASMTGQLDIDARLGSIRPEPSGD